MQNLGRFQLKAVQIRSETSPRRHRALTQPFHSLCIWRSSAVHASGQDKLLLGCNWVSLLPLLSWGQASELEGGRLTILTSQTSHTFSPKHFPVYNPSILASELPVVLPSTLTLVKLWGSNRSISIILKFCVAHSAHYYSLWTFMRLLALWHKSGKVAYMSSRVNDLLIHFWHNNLDPNMPQKGHHSKCFIRKRHALCFQHNALTNTDLS